MKVTYQIQVLALGNVAGESRISIGTTMHDGVDGQKEDELTDEQDIDEEGIRE